MKRLTRKRAVMTGIALVVVAAIVYAFLPDPVPVQTATVTRGPLQVIIEEEGETRLEDRYLITAPVAAFAQRIELEVGDPVRPGQAVVRLEPPRSPILDPRAQSEAAARVAAARAQLGQAEIVATRAVEERARVERLVAAGAATRQALEQTTTEAARALAARDAARAELAAAEAALRTATGAVALGTRTTITAPAAGRVLEVHRRSEGPVAPGEPLLEVGDTERLRVTADVLSQDAVRIRPGTPVMLDQWGGDVTLNAVVSRVEPHGFTQVSALGVEEQRVTVMADLVSPPTAHAGLGPGYRVLARFVVWEDADALQVPTAALFRHDEGWAVFVVEGGRASLRPVDVGQEAGLRTQILSGLVAGETVVVHPGNDVADGVRVRG
jgi:HlyD family secretion protein